MLKLYFITNGSTLWDCSPFRCQGWKDVPLSQKGLLQAKILALSLREINFLAMYSSPLTRANKTAQIISEKLKLNFIEDDRLKEANCGLWEGKIMDNLAVEENEKFNLWLNSPEEFNFPQGESLVDLQDKIINFCTEITQKHQKGNILIVTHSGTLKAFLCKVLNESLNYFHTFNINNGSISVVNYKNDNFELEEINKIINEKELPLEKLTSE